MEKFVLRVPKWQGELVFSKEVLIFLGVILLMIVGILFCFYGYKFFHTILLLAIGTVMFYVSFLLIEPLTSNSVIRMFLTVSLTFLGMSLVYFLSIIFGFILDKLRIRTVLAKNTYLVAAPLGAAILGLTIYYMIWRDEIVAGAVAGVCLIIGLIFQFFKRKKQVQFRTYNDLIKLPLPEHDENGLGYAGIKEESKSEPDTIKVEEPVAESAAISVEPAAIPAEPVAISAESAEVPAEVAAISAETAAMPAETEVLIAELAVALASMKTSAPASEKETAVELTEAEPVKETVVELTEAEPEKAPVVELTEEEPEKAPVVALAEAEPVKETVVELTEAEAEEVPAVALAEAEPVKETVVELTEAEAEEAPAVALAEAEPVKETVVELTEAEAEEAPAVALAEAEPVKETVVELTEAEAEEAPAVALAEAEPVKETVVELTEAEAEEAPAVALAEAKLVKETVIELTEAELVKETVVELTEAEPEEAPAVALAEAKPVKETVIELTEAEPVKETVAELRETAPKKAAVVEFIEKEVEALAAKLIEAEEKASKPVPERAVVNEFSEDTLSEKHIDNAVKTKPKSDNESDKSKGEDPASRKITIVDNQAITMKLDSKIVKGAAFVATGVGFFLAGRASKGGN